MGTPGVASDQSDPEGRASVWRPVQRRVRPCSGVFDALDPHSDPGLGVARGLENTVWDVPQPVATIRQTTAIIRAGAKHMAYRPPLPSSFSTAAAISSRDRSYSP